jgi:hypothetical protein
MSVLSAPPKARAPRHSAHEIVADILAGLTWQQVRPRLREIAVPGVTGTRYFDLSGESSQLVMLLRERAEKSGISSRVFTHRDGQPWASECLVEALALISAR